MPTIDNIDYPDTLREMRGNRPVLRVFMAYWPSKLTTQARAFVQRSNRINMRNAQSLFEMSGLEENKNFFKLPTRDANAFRGKLARGGSVRTDTQKLQAIVAELRTHVTVRAQQLAFRDFYRSTNFQRYHDRQVG